MIKKKVNCKKNLQCSFWYINFRSKPQRVTGLWAKKLNVALELQVWDLVSNHLSWFSIKLHTTCYSTLQEFQNDFAGNSVNMTLTCRSVVSASLASASVMMKTPTTERPPGSILDTWKSIANMNPSSVQVRLPRCTAHFKAHSTPHLIHEHNTCWNQISLCWKRGMALFNYLSSMLGDPLLVHRVSSCCSRLLLLGGPNCHDNKIPLRWALKYLVSNID